MDDEPYVPPDLFREFVARLPRVSVELMVSYPGGVLLCHRLNEPAKGEWFWPGSLLHKNESFEDCARRVGREELDITVDIVEQVGTYAHFWESSKFAGVDSTHTVNVVYHVEPQSTVEDIVLDDQHDDWRLVTRIEDWMHPYVKRYLTASGLLERYQ